MNEDPPCKKKSQTRSSSLHDILDTFLPRHLYDVCPPLSPHRPVLGEKASLTGDQTPCVQHLSVDRRVSWPALPSPCSQCGINSISECSLWSSWSAWQEFRSELRTPLAEVVHCNLLKCNGSKIAKNALIFLNLHCV